MATALCIPSISSPCPNKLSPSNSIKPFPSPSHLPRRRGSTKFVSVSTAGNPLGRASRVRALAAPAGSIAGFDEMVSGTRRNQVRATTGENGESPRTLGNYGICDSASPDVSESSRLHASLKKENVPVKRLVVNQILLPSASDCKFCAMKRKDQMRALDMIHNDSELSSLSLIQAPLVDVEIRGVPALKFMGDVIWK